MVLQEHHHAIECQFGLIAQDGFVKVIVDVVDDLWLEHGVQDKVHIILGILLGRVALKGLLGIEVAVGTSHHHIFDTPL